MKRNSFLGLLYLLVFCLPLFAGVRRELPALCYHQVEPKPSGRFSLSVKKFVEQLAYLKEHGYTTLNTDELLAIVNSEKQFPNKKVIISFDDGYKTVYEYAFPIMKKMGFIGIACIYPKFIGCGNAMTWKQVKELANNGWSIECHSYSHADLSKKYGAAVLEKLFLEQEIVKSRKIIQEHTGLLPKLMVWPYGIYTDKTLRVAKQEGFLGALTVDGGANYSGIDPFFIKRQVIYGTDSLTKFIIRFEMGGLKLTERCPAPGTVLRNLATFSFKIPSIASYSDKLYKLNVRLSHSRCSFSYNNELNTVTGKVLSHLRSGNYFIDVYLRNKKTGITKQNGWLFTIKP